MEVNVGQRKTVRGWEQSGTGGHWKTPLKHKGNWRVEGATGELTLDLRYVKHIGKAEVGQIWWVILEGIQHPSGLLTSWAEWNENIKTDCSRWKSPYVWARVKSASLLMSVLNFLHLFFCPVVITSLQTGSKIVIKPYFNQSGIEVIEHALNLCSHLFLLIKVNMTSWNSKEKIRDAWWSLLLKKDIVSFWRSRFIPSLITHLGQWKNCCQSG